jgi:glycosyltransferase involved in cell wall biosynthesis
VLGDIPSLREIWHGAAEFVPPDDPQALRSVLKALIGNQRYRQRLGRAAYQRAQCFKATTMAEQYLRCYRILLGYGRRPPETSPILNL